MKIHELIRVYRKKQGLTQEQVANYLGVSAPAVNKWESGSSYPDITLLAPLARILETDVDTLLSFHEELTDIEIAGIMNEIAQELGTKGYPATFDKAAGIIKAYSGCNKLILGLAMTLSGYLLIETADIPDRVKHQKQIKAWLEAVAFCDDKETANMAIISLSQSYMNQGEYKEAQRLLDEIPPVGFDKRCTQAGLYARQGEYEKAYDINESMLYHNASDSINNLMQITSWLCRQNEYEAALQYADFIDKVAKLFDLGKYIGASARFCVYAEMKREEESLDALELILEGIDSYTCARASKLYRHMKFKEGGGSALIQTLHRAALENDDSVAFLKENPRFKQIMKQMQ